MTTNYVEITLDPEYITPDGAYMAGYIWGQHVRTEKDARQMFPGDTELHENFYKGVADGYNDKTNEMDAQMKAPKRVDKSTTVAELGKVYSDGGITLDQYKSMVDSLYDYVKEDEFARQYERDLEREMREREEELRKYERQIEEEMRRYDTMTYDPYVDSKDYDYYSRRIDRDSKIPWRGKK